MKRVNISALVSKFKLGVTITAPIDAVRASPIYWVMFLGSTTLSSVMNCKTFPGNTVYDSLPETKDPVPLIM